MKTLTNKLNKRLEFIEAVNAWFVFDIMIRIKASNPIVMLQIFPIMILNKNNF